MNCWTGAATLEALKRPGAAEPAKAGDAVVVPKHAGTQGFYKVWVSDAPKEAERDVRRGATDPLGAED